MDDIEINRESRLYYTAPTDEQFTECKEAAIKLWYEVDTDHNEFGYATEKINQIVNIGNIADNFMYMVAMFDHENQAKLAEKLSPETRLAIRERMLAGGNPLFLIPF